VWLHRSRIIRRVYSSCCQIQRCNNAQKKLRAPQSVTSPIRISEQ
jgi:hypothetical protein